MKESRDFEFKLQVTKGFLKTVSAFANFGAGTILFGVDDNGIPVGIENPSEVCLDIENRINDVFDPRPSFSLEVDKDNHTIALNVEEGFDKPYLCNGKAYRRSDASTVEVDKLELRRLVLRGQNLDFDELPCGIESPSFSHLESSLRESIGIGSLTDDSLRTLGLLGKDGFNNAAAILADENKFPGVDIALFGESEDIILDRASVSGESVLDSFSKAMEFYERHCCYERISGVVRENVEMIPRKAFREAVANALAHRTWDVSAPVRISISPHRAEILSPGGLVPGMTAGSYLEGRYSMLRNPILADVLFRLGIIEKFGTGVVRIRRSYEDTGKSPSFEVGDDFIRASLPVLSADQPIGEDERRVLAEMPKRQLVTRAAIDRSTGFEKTKTIRVLNALEGKGLIRAVGEGRARKYMRM